MYRVVFIALVISASDATCKAEVLVDQHPAINHTDFSVWSNLPAPGFAQQVTDDFLLPANHQIDELSWSGFYFDSPIGGLPNVDFTVRLFAEGSRHAGQLLFSTLTSVPFEQTGTTENAGGQPVYRFTLQLAVPLVFETETELWLSVLDSDPDTGADFRWLFSQSHTGSPAATRRSDADSWTILPAAFAFTVNGHRVPEPSTFALLVVGCAALRYRYRR